jgi:hypothetical protein
MAADPVGVRMAPASHLLGRKLDSIPFSAYHVVIILVLGFVGFIEGYDLALTGSLLVLATIRHRSARPWTLFGKPFARIFPGVIVSFMMVSHTGSPTIFFGTMLVMVAMGACIPFALGRETLGNPETFTEAVPELA